MGLNIHQDDRRTLESFPEAKIITAKQDCVIGKHYHKVKTEKFILTLGACGLHCRDIGENKRHYGFEMVIGRLYSIPPNTYHEFHIEKGSVLVGINSHPYDPLDDYKI